MASRVKVPSPRECGLPEKFDSWRAGQEEALHLLRTDTHRHIDLCAPTGFGKSPLVMADALLSGEPTCFVTASRGLQDQYMCLALGTKVCTGDLHWVPIETCQVGDILLGFDEFRSPNRRMWRSSTVTACATTYKHCLQITLSDGRAVICSTEHRWLVGDSGGHGLSWVKAEHLKVGEPLNDVLDMWECASDYAAGYLAAAFDGEGHLHQSKNTTNGRDVNLSFCQASNPMLTEVRRLLQAYGFNFNESTDRKAEFNPKHQNCTRITIGGRRDVFRFLGMIRPQRLLPKLSLDMMGMLNPAIPVMITDIKSVGKLPVYFLETSTHTFVAEGLASHNSDFAEIGLVDIRGRSNYSCNMKEGYTCEDGYVARCPYKGTVACPSSQAEMRAATSSLVVTNYSKWTYSKKFGQGMSHFTRVVFDEFHNAPGAIAQAMQIQLNSKEIEDGLKVGFLEGSDADSMEMWKSWAVGAKAVAEVAMIAAQARITGVNDPKQAWIRHYTHMRNLVRKLGILALAKPTNWVVDRNDYGYQFDPIRPGMYGESTLFLRVPKVIGVSATLRPKTMFMCGVGRDNFIFKEFDSDFDRKRCPIYYVPTMRVDSRAADLGELWAMLDRVAAKRRDRKGIVHTVSYARQEEIAQRSRFFQSMIVNPKGEPATETVEIFKDSEAGTILVTPSCGEGYDFPGDECRWQFVCKIPFEPPSKIVKAREQDDPEYRAYQAIQTMVQAFGRGMRSKSDYCENFICDTHLDWFLPRYGHLAPRSFHGFFQHTPVLPQPLRF